MVRVDFTTTDKITAWRIRDRLACHPLLGGAAAQIIISASHEHVTISGWTNDEGLSEIAVRMARGAAGRRLVSVNLDVGVRCKPGASSVEPHSAYRLR